MSGQNKTSNVAGVPKGSAAEPTSLSGAARAFTNAARLLRHGPAVGAEASRFALETARIAVGRSDIAPPRGDRRFADPAWQGNPVYKRIAQTYLAGCEAVDRLGERLVEDDVPHAETARFVSGIITSAMAPTNYYAGNPEAIKKGFDTGGASLLKGVSNWATDLVHNGGMPATAKPGVFTVGVDLAVTPGSVIARDDVAELIQYTPVTEEVYERPTLIIPPPIGRFYFLDLAPTRSFVEYAVSEGLQMFMLSWRNPTREQADWGIDTYAARILSAIAEVKAVTGQDDVNVVGFCAGGILESVALNKIAASGDDSVHSATFAVTLLDWSGKNPINAFNTLSTISFAGWNSQRKGVMEARSMGSAFTWMRPNDLVWNYWVNNYLLGQDPPVFDILSWNADGTRLPATLHREFLDIFSKNPLAYPGARTFLGEPVDLSRITVPCFVQGAVNDHLTPWRGTYRTTELVGSSDVTYVLSNAGHIASLVNPPSNLKASYFTGPPAGRMDAETWRAGATKEPGSWWTAWITWCRSHSGDLTAAPSSPGAGPYRELTKAPGLYVRDKVPA